MINNRIIISNSKRLLTNYYKYVVVNVLKILVHSTITGDFSSGVTPVLIPNTEVKTTSAEYTCLETSRERRSLPVFPKCISSEMLFLWKTGLHRRCRVYEVNAMTVVVDTYATQRCGIFQNASVSRDVFCVFCADNVIHIKLMFVA